jgi:hypothetical protein
MTQTMRASVITKPYTLETQELAAPNVGPGEVRVRVAAAGVCGTDLCQAMKLQASSIKSVRAFWTCSRVIVSRSILSSRAALATIVNAECGTIARASKPSV